MKTIKQLLTTIAVLLCSVVANAYDFEVDGIYYNITSAGNLTVEVTYSSDCNYIGIIEIPAIVTYNEQQYSVTSIGNNAFCRCLSILSISIPNSITSIGDNAFKQCSSLISITIPNSVISIGNDIFYNCLSLTSIIIPNSVTKVGYSIFYGCKSLKSVILSENITSLRSYCSGNFIFGFFEGCSSLESIIIPGNVTSIEDEAFYNCSSLSSITIPKNLTSIGKSVFDGCSSLSSITWDAERYRDLTAGGTPLYAIRNQIKSFTFGDNVERIPAYLCYGMDNLTSVIIGNRVTSIGEGAFVKSSLSSITWNAIRCDDDIFNSQGQNTPFYLYVTQTISYDIRSQIKSFTFGDNVQHIPSYLCNRMKNVTSITIPNNVTSIGKYAFADCSGITSVNIPNSVTSIGAGAFSGCSGITSVNIPNSVTSIGKSVFYYCSSLLSITIPESVTSIGDKAFYYCSSLLSITIPESVTSIGDEAFCGCKSLASLTIPNNVTSIGDGAFGYCSIDTINITAKNIKDYYKNNNINRLLLNANIEKERHLIIDGEEIKNLIVTTEDIKDINNFAFYKFSNIESITIPNSVTSIGNYAFYGCSGLSSITIPNSVTSIGNYAFYGCSGLSSITIEATTPPTLNGNLYFSGIIYIPNNTLLAYKKAWGDEYNFVCNENSLTIHIETPGTLSDKIFEAWQRPENVVKLTLTGTLNKDDFTLIRETMTLLIDVDLSGIMNTEGINFKGKTNLKNIRLPKDLSTIEDKAFYGCSSLDSITIPEKVTAIGNSAFYNCSSLTSVIIGNSVTAIGNSAFYNCSSLTSVIIGNSVTSIGESAFEKCSSLTSVTIGNSVTSIGNGAFYSCSSLSSVHISDIVAWCNIDFATISSNPMYYAKELYLNNNKIETLVIPEGVNSIKEYTFMRCKSLSSITIGNSVTAIVEDAFYGCSSLSSVTCLSTTPPATTGDLGIDKKTCKLIIPKEAYVDYLKHEYWGQFLTMDTLNSNVYKKVNILVNDPSFGSVNISNGYCRINDSITISATPYKGYHFSQWSDGNTENPRTIVVTQDTTFTAEFAQNPTYNVTLYAENGKVSGAGTYYQGDTITITAKANRGYEFKEWSDGNTENPRSIVVTNNIELTAIFEKIDTPVENIFNSQISFYTTDGTLHIEGVESDYQIYTTTGQCVYSGKETTLTLPRGIYLITINGNTQKIAL